MATKRTFKQQLAGWIRWFHIYISMLGFLALLFFAVTGLTVNHTDWFQLDEPVTKDVQGQLSESLRQAVLPVESDDEGDKIDKLAVAEYLRSEHALRGKVKEFAVDEEECMILFKGPAQSADVVVMRADGKYSVRTTYLGLVPLWNDLHKGRDTGADWSLFIDISAVLMTLTSLTGIVLLLFLKKRRTPGLVVAVIGTVVVFVVYYAFVP